MKVFFFMYLRLRRKNSDTTVIYVWRVSKQQHKFVKRYFWKSHGRTFWGLWEIIILGWLVCSGVDVFSSSSSASLCVSAENGVRVQQLVSALGLSAVCPGSDNLPHRTDTGAQELHTTHAGERHGHTHTHTAYHPQVLHMHNWHDCSASVLWFKEETLSLL